MTKLDLLDKIKAAGYVSNEVAVTIEDFFEGNNFEGTIGVNIWPDSLTAQFFYERFKELKQHPKVYDILIRIADTDGDWFYSDTAYINCSLTLDELREQLEVLKFDEIYDGWMYDKPVIIDGSGNVDQTVFSLW